MPNVEDRAREIIQNNIYITLATSSEGQPWNTPVYAVSDEQYAFRWISWVHARHSQNIRKNGNVFMVIYNTTREYGTNHRRCLYVQAIARELNTKKEIALALNNFHFPNRSNPPIEDLRDESVKRMYEAVPEKMWLNNKAESQMTKEDNEMRIEVPLAELLRQKS